MSQVWLDEVAKEEEKNREHLFYLKGEMSQETIETIQNLLKDKKTKKIIINKE